MKIAYCHNYYRNRGGEDVSFDSDLRLLNDNGHTVIPFTRDNDSLGGNSLAMAANSLWNRRVETEFADLLDATNPDVVHCNNLFPQISLSVYRPARKRGIPIVQSLRNYRAFCANSFLYRNGGPCTKCLHSSASWRGLVHRCYRDSFSATAVVAAGQLWNRALRVQKRYVDAYLTPSQFARDIFIQGGYDPSKIHWRYNFVSQDHGMVPTKSKYGLFVGRLSPEKGVDTMIRAWQQLARPMSLRIVGSGPQEQSLCRLAKSCSQIEFLGQLEQREVLDQIGHASFLVMPSQWFETFGRTIAEAFSRGTPVIASRLGAMQELVRDGENGLLFEPGNPSSLADVVGQWESLSPFAQAAMNQEARNSHEQYFSSERSYRQLLDVYQQITGRGSVHSII